jgi:hypothetical protein
MDERGSWDKIEEPQLTTPVAKKYVMWLKVGQIVTIEGEPFRVRKVTRKDVVLRSVRCKVENEDG